MCPLLLYETICESWDMQAILSYAVLLYHRISSWPCLFRISSGIDFHESDDKTGAI